MRWLFACVWVLAMFACGDDGKTAIDAPAMIDAPGDGVQQFACMSAAGCGGNACCMTCSPGGACLSQCSADNMCRNGGTAMCDPAAADPCLKADGTAGVCQEMQFGPIVTSKYWVCTSM